MVEHPGDGKVPLDFTVQGDDESAAVYLARLAREAALSDYQRNWIRRVATPPAPGLGGDGTVYPQSAEMAFMWQHQMVGGVRRAARAGLAFLQTLEMMVN